MTAVYTAIGDAYRRYNLTTAGLADALGQHGVAALHRGEPAAVRWNLKGRTDELATLIRAFILRDPTSGSALDAIIGAGTASALLANDAVALADGGQLQLLIDIRPHLIDGSDVIVISDADASMTQHIPGPEHVLGVGAASISLLESTPRSRVDSVLDVGTGSGVQVLGQLACANTITATDVHPRAVELARATLAANGVQETSITLHEGSWFEPVAGQKFDRIVSNPPFVVGLPEVGHVYRDSGLNLDGASELMMSTVADYLTPGGTAHLLASWVHPADGSWRQRLASWLPDTGVDAWILQRDVADPELYVATWLADESLDLRSAVAARRTEAWLDHFAQREVTGIGFGFVAIRQIGDRPSEVVIEELTQPFSDPLGDEVEEYFHRTAWLREQTTDSLGQAQFQLRPSVVREDIAVTDDDTGMGFESKVLRLTRTDGPRFSHEVDSAVASIVAGLHPQGLVLEEVIGLFAASQGIEGDAAGQLLEQAITAVVELVRHGILIPAQLLDGYPAGGDA